jgi:antitoxin (DNA-binding transcriptional repressor) of toxin-antitoxin stability system
MGDAERIFEILPKHEYLFNGNALELKGEHLNTLQNLLGLRQYAVEPVGDKGTEFWITKDGVPVAHMFPAKNADRRNGHLAPNILMIMAVPGFEEHLDNLASDIQKWMNNPQMHGGRRRRRRNKTKRSRRTRKAQRKH